MNAGIIELGFGLLSVPTGFMLTLANYKFLGNSKSPFSSGPAQIKSWGAIILTVGELSTVWGIYYLLRGFIGW